LTGSGVGVVEPDWLTWSRDLQAIAQNGLTFTRDPFDRERFEQVRALAAQIMAAHSGAPQAQIEELFRAEKGYATPKVDVRGAVFDQQGRLLMVREIADGGRWTLPGGWADVNLTPAENVIREVREESGYVAKVRKLAAVWDRTRQGHPVGVFSCCKLFYVCELVGGVATPSLETSEVAWFTETALPLDDVSGGRVLPRQIRRMFAHFKEPTLPADFE
jgi:ADP-ribose pyrophosphatase YjhB (NUDIX family)